MAGKKLVGLHLLDLVASESEKCFEGVHARVAIGEVQGGDVEAVDLVEIGSAEELGTLSELAATLGDVREAKVAVVLPPYAAAGLAFELPATEDRWLSEVVRLELEIASHTDMDGAWWTCARRSLGHRVQVSALGTPPEAMASYTAALAEVGIPLPSVSGVTALPNALLASFADELRGKRVVWIERDLAQFFIGRDGYCWGSLCRRLDRDAASSVLAFVSEHRLIADGERLALAGDWHTKFDIGQITGDRPHALRPDRVQALALREIDRPEFAGAVASLRLAAEWGRTLNLLTPMKLKRTLFSSRPAKMVEVPRNRAEKLLDRTAEGAARFSTHIRHLGLSPSEAVLESYASYAPPGVSFSVTEETGQVESESSRELCIPPASELASREPEEKLLALVLLQAVQDRADEIRLEPLGEALGPGGYGIRYTIGGVLYEMVPPPRSVALAMIRRIKEAAHVDTEPGSDRQFGVTSLSIGDRTIDVHAHFHPTPAGDIVSLKLVEHARFRHQLGEIAAPREQMLTAQAMARRGLVLIASPPRNGRTATLLSLLRPRSQPPNRTVLCTEGAAYGDDLVYVSVHPYQPNEPLPQVLSSLVRDYHLIGVDHPLVEDHLVQLVDLASRGALVVATISGASPASTIARLLAAGVDRHLLAETLQCVITPRLLPRLCERCRRPDDLASEALQNLGLEGHVAGEFSKRGDCNRCASTGVRGRVGVSQVLLVGNSVRDSIQRGHPDLSEVGQDASMDPLVAKGLELARKGIVSLADLAPLFTQGATP